VTGTVYTETVVHSAPARLVTEAPYQIAIVVLENGERLTGRIQGAAVRIGDSVELLEHRGGVPWFRKTAATAAEQ
jgi:uncharacterized OB-fold protein